MNTQEIQDEINKAFAEGRNAVIPKGIHVITTTIIIPDDVELKGE